MHAFFLDIDGTILDAKGIVQNEDRDAILAARERGDKVFINTARPLSALPAAIKELPFDGFICSCGQVLAAEGNVLYNRTIPHELIEKAVALCDELYLRASFFNVNEKKMYHDENGVKSAEELQNINQLYIYTSVTDELAQRFAEYFEVHYAKVNPQTLRCMLPGTSKASGIMLAEKLLSIRHEDTVAIGDYDDDISMIRYAQVGITLASALPETIDAADYVSKPLSEAGTGYAIMHPELWEK